MQKNKRFPGTKIVGIRSRDAFTSGIAKPHIGIPDSAWPDIGQSVQDFGRDGILPGLFVNEQLFGVIGNHG